MERVRYKVIEKTGDLGEVVQVKVRDVGVDSRDFAPVVRVASLRECPAQVAEFAGLIPGPSCPSCRQKEAYIRRLVEYIRELEATINTDRAVSALMLKMENAEGDGVEQPKNGVRSSPQRSASGTFSYAFPTSQNITFEETDGEGHPTLMEMMTDELRRQSLLTAMMSLLNRPTLEEIVTIGEEMRAEQTKNLQPVALNKGS